MIERKSKLSIHNKIMLYKQIMKPVWTYGIQLWGCNKATNINKVQIFQNKILRDIVDARWFMRNADIRKDLNITSVEEEITKAARNHELRLANHQNIEAVRLLDIVGQLRRLKRTKPADLSQRGTNECSPAALL